MSKFTLATPSEKRDIQKRYGLKFHSTFLYCTNSNLYDEDIGLQRSIKDYGFTLRYLDGCFKPFLYKVKK